MLSRKAMVPVYDDPSMPLHYFGVMASEVENIYIHQYARPDRDDPHCHPWPNASLIVSGWYDENVYETGSNKFIGVERRHEGDIILRDSSSVHAIVDTSPGCLTVFASLQKDRDWGFYTETGFIHSTAYHANSASLAA